LDVISVALSYAGERLNYRQRVRLSVCLSHAGIDSKLMTVGSFGFLLSGRRYGSNYFDRSVGEAPFRGRLQTRLGLGWV